MSVGSWNCENVGIGRAKTVMSRVRNELAVIREVRWSFATQRLEDQKGQLEIDLFFTSNQCKHDKTGEMWSRRLVPISS